jgi:hypothetical protein
LRRCDRGAKIDVEARRQAKAPLLSVLRWLLRAGRTPARRSTLVQILWRVDLGGLSWDAEQVGILDDEVDASRRCRRLLDVERLLDEQQRIERILLRVARVAQQRGQAVRVVAGEHCDGW